MQKNELFKPLLAAAIFFLLSTFFYGFFRLGDDTYIYLQYAKNIASGSGISFNAGERTYGFTSPLWLGLILLLNMVVKDITESPRILSMLFSVASIYVWYYILKRFFKVVPFLFLALLAVEPNLLKHSNLGMEASLSFFLGSLFILQFMLSEKKDIWRNFRLAAVSGAFFLVRPESVLLFAAAQIYLYLKKKSNVNEIAIAVCFWLAIIVPWHVFAYTYFGSAFPTTFFAKGGNLAWGTHWQTHLFDSLRIFVGNYASYFILAIAAFFLRKKISGKQATENENLLLPTVPTGFFLFLPVLFIIFYMFAINREYVYARYYCIVFPFILLAVFSLLHSVGRSKQLILAFAVIVLAQFVATTVYASNLTRKNFVVSEKVEDQIIDWVAANTRMDDRIVHGRIGKIGFMTDRRIIDPQGIINPDFLPYVKSNTMPEYYSALQPEYYIGDSLGLQCVVDGKGTAQQLIIFTYNAFPIRDNRTAHTEKISVYKLYWK